MTPHPRRIWLAFLLVLAGALGAEEPAAKPFDIPSGPAERTLKAFSAQSGAEVLYATASTGKVRTNAVRGSYTVSEALDRLLEGTGLIAIRDEANGTFSITHDPNAERAPLEKGSGRPAAMGANGSDDSAPARQRPIPTLEPRFGAGDETVSLNPFEVQADSDKSYGALNSNSITAFNAALDNLPVTADVMDQAFMRDVGAVSMEDMVMSYDASAALDSSVVGNAVTNQPGDHQSGTELSLRGATTGRPQYNGLLIAGNGGGTNWNYTSIYDLERVEVINGPQALLFAGAGAGGVVNLVTKEARLGQPAFGSVDYRIDQYGSKSATLDFGASRGPLAVRVALVDGTDDSRRVNVGDQLQGAYVQFAASLGNTIARLSLSQSVDFRAVPTYMGISSSSGDPLFPYNSDKLTYLLATGQAGGILNGQLNWGNVNSYQGVWSTDKQVSERMELAVASVWTKWLATNIQAALGNFENYQFLTGANLYTPDSSSNPLPGNWTIGMQSSGRPFGDRWRPNRDKGIRFTAVLTNELFGGKAKSQTGLDWDYTGRTTNLVNEGWFQADGNFNVTVIPGATADGGRIALPTQGWTVNQGPQYYTFFNPGISRLTLNGVDYVRMFTHWVGAVPATPANPYGQASGATGTYQVNGAWSQGYGLVNDTQWLNGKVDTLLGLRLNHQKNYIEFGNTDEPQKPDFNAGVNYHLLPWLTPYVGASDDWSAVASGNPSVDGTLPKDAHSIGEEVGLKFNGFNRAISGSVSAYHSRTTNAQYDSGNVVSGYIDPTGLNGKVSTNTNFSTTGDTKGLAAALTAVPLKDWRMRLSAAVTQGQFKAGAVYGLLYNDQFYENAAGQVTYADGTAVNVPAVFNSKQLTVPAGSAGAVPLTATLLSTPGSQYFANPQAVNGAILKTSNGGLVLLSTPDPVHGAIITGATALPISSYQLLPSLSGVTPFQNLTLVQPGDKIWGYPTYSFSFTNVYEFSSGWLKGLKLGGTIIGRWKQLDEYYYPAGFNGANFSSRQQFFLPTVAKCDLIAGYSRKVGTRRWSTQLNVYNMFNHYHVIIFPDPVTGWSVSSNLNANFDQQPRSYAWTNTLSF